MESVVNKVLDQIDVHILDILQRQADLSNTEIAKRVNLSSPAVHTRIKRLEQDGYINQHVAILNQEKLGFDLLCFIFISTNLHQAEELSKLERALERMPEVLECQCITGEYDYLLKVANRNRRDLQAFIRKLNGLGINKIQTNLALREVKSSTVLPIIEEDIGRETE